MKAIRNINNNVAVCLDDNGFEVIVMGKGVGFEKTPHEVALKDIDQTFYNISAHYVSLLDEVPEEVLKITRLIVQKGQQYLKMEVKPSFLFSLCDHIHFAIENTKKGLILSNPMSHEIPHMYEKEYKMGMWAVDMIRKKTEVKLPRSEAATIALHFVNASQDVKNPERNEIDRFVEDITDIIESELNMIIDREEYNYSRFVTHLKYLLKRTNTLNKTSVENAKMFDKVYANNLRLQSTLNKLKIYITAALKVEPSKDELLYLLIHLNRMIASEGM